MQAVVWAGGTQVEVRDLPVPEPSPRWTLVDVAYAGLCGTDLHICDDEHPRAKPGLVIGHELVGRLTSPLGELLAGTPVFVNPLLWCGNCPSCKRGRYHTCYRLQLLGIDRDGGAAEVVAVPEDHVLPLPEGVDMRRAALIEPLSVAVRAVRRSGMRLGDRVHVLGAGPMGLLVANCARLGGASEVTISEVSPVRALAAQAMGLGLIDHDPPQPIADVLFDCTGHPAVSPTLSGWVLPGGTVTMVAAYPGVVPVNLQEVMFREISLVGTRVYSFEDITVAIGVVEREGPMLDPLVTAVVPLSEGPWAISALHAGSELKVLLKGPAA
ncbi:MAG: alcohol dehydrogenase catalytic domain-containing protein [Acidimicrobiales bacterium]|jgi:threonine dehydrogenase-like Zn-dependent dehydrogenase